MHSEQIRRVLQEYGEPFASAQFVYHPSSGFSGARLWRCDIGGGQYVLRRWPDGQMSVARLEMVHQFVQQAASELAFIPVLVVSRAGGTYVEYDGTFWQLETWLPGEADLTDPPRLQRVAAAVEALARFHEAMVRRHVTPCSGSPALADRAELLDEMLGWGIERIRNAPTFVAPLEPWTGIAMAARPWLAGLLPRAAAMRAALAEPLSAVRTLQPVIRDITRDHVLFIGDTVAGIVDFGAMACDHVTVDLARLAGSYGGAASMVDHIWRSYQASKYAPRLTDDDRRLMELLDRSGVLVATYRWLRWIFVEERSFADPKAVAGRIGRLIARTEAF